MYNEQLYHYGIRGQKWGVRRYQNADGSLTELGKRRMKPDKAVAKMTDEELAKITNRLELESKYKSLRHEDTRRGKEAAAMAIKAVGAIGLASVGIASITVGKEALKKCGMEMGQRIGNKLATAITESVSTGVKNASDKAVKTVSDSAKNIVKDAGDMIKKATTNTKISEKQRSEILSKATEIGRKAAQKALDNNTISPEDASAYANKIRQKAYSQLIQNITKQSK